jgi:uncharacterized membrane-anchored protein YitT (DUF2179 family)
MTPGGLNFFSKWLNRPLSAQTDERPPIHVLDVVMILLGMFIYSSSVNLFLVNAKLLSGGLTGIALILQYLFKFPSALTILVLNIPLFLLSWYKLSRRFSALTILGVLANVVFLAVTSRFSTVLKLDDILLNCLLGGALKGVGMAMALAHQGSSGGLDIISVYWRKRDNRINIGSYIFIFNLVIVLLGTLFFGIASGVYTVVSLYIASLVIDMYINRISQRKALLIISKKSDEIAGMIMKKINRGVTYLYGEGAYTQDSYKVIFCVIPAQQLFAAKQNIHQLDRNAFISIINTAEVEGHGFYNTI